MVHIFKTSLIFSLFLLPAIGFSQVAANVDVDAMTFENKRIPKELAVDIKEALSYYPELENISIDFIFKKKIHKAVMQAQPRGSSLLRKKANRRYKVKISRYLVLQDTIKAIEEVPHDILVGWIAHELGHVMDYRDRGGLQMVGFGIKYLTSLSFLKKTERRADVYAIKHGLAENIIKTKNYILHKEDLPLEYRQRISTFYISPDEVKAIEAEMGEI